MLENWPELPNELRIYRSAFKDLSSDRPQGMSGIQPIPWSAIDRWAARHAMGDPDDFERLVALVRAQDNALIEYHRGEQTKGEDQQDSDPNQDEVVKF